MIPALRNVFRVVLLLSAFGLCVAGYENSEYIFLYYLFLYTLGLGYHLLFDEVRIKLFVTVFSMFIISSAFGVFFTFNNVLKGETGALIYLNTVQLFWILGFVLIFLKMFREYPLKIKLHKWSWVIVLILVLDFFCAQKIINLVDAFGMSSMHILYTFAYTILKLVLLSVGLIYHFGSVKTSVRISYITAAFLFFFLSDIIDVFNTLMFFDHPEYGFSLLKSGMFCIALVFFYMYCVTSDPSGILKREALLKKRSQGGAP
ncbi:MAG: hypothetical protein KTR22_09180 [Flavobacteriaceae bacterium]|nr:hypothetical protein [Flavobacteriaceae bacterium]